MKANAERLVALTPWRTATGKELVDLFVDLGERVRRYRSSCVGSLVGGLASRARDDARPGLYDLRVPHFRPVGHP